MYNVHVKNYFTEYAALSKMFAKPVNPGKKPSATAKTKAQVILIILAICITVMPITNLFLVQLLCGLLQSVLTSNMSCLLRKPTICICENHG